MCLQILHSLGKERLELVNSLEGYVNERVLPLLKPVDKCWQPADYLPDPSKEDYLDQVCIVRWTNSQHMLPCCELKLHHVLMS